jgi:hypothetical protein
MSMIVAYMYSEVRTAGSLEGRATCKKRYDYSLRLERIDKRDINHRLKRGICV